MNEHWTHESDDDYIEPRKFKAKSNNGCNEGFVLLGLLAVGLGVMLMLTLVASHTPTHKIATEKRCPPGVTKIEFGKGIDCNGDTIQIFEYANRPR